MWFLESPIPALAIGGVVFAALTAGLVQTGSRRFQYAMLLTVLLATGAVFLERVVVTPREEVGEMLNALAADLERNDAEAVLRHVSASSPALRDEAARLLGQIVVDRASVKRNLEVDSHGDVAEARFNGVIVATEKSGMISKQPYPRYFVLKLRKEGGQWRVRQYEHYPPHKRVGGSGVANI